MNDDTQVALEYFKALRKEIIERLKMRDAILLGFLTATGVFLGLGLKNEALWTWLQVFLPLFALGAAYTVTTHQEQIVTFNHYITRDLGQHLSSGPDKVIDFNESKACRKYTSHNLWMGLAAQLILLCGPSLLVILANKPFLTKKWTYKEFLSVLGLVLTLLTAGRIWVSRKFRQGVMAEIQGSKSDAGTGSAAVSGNSTAAPTSTPAASGGHFHAHP